MFRAYRSAWFTEEKKGYQRGNLIRARGNYLYSF
jgi:hypothetical protein